MRDNEKEDARKRGGGGADKRGGVHSRYQFFRCGKIGGGMDKRWGALWRYSTVLAFCLTPFLFAFFIQVSVITFISQ